MNTFTIQRLCAWSGMAAVGCFFLGLILADFIPPASPAWSVDQVVAHYQAHTTGIRVGMLIVMISGMFMAPLIGVISAQLSRIQGIAPGLSYAQISGGTIGIAFFILPGVFFLITAFRPDRPPEITYLMNDFSWIMLVLPWPPAFIQNTVIAVAVLCDKSTQPIFPRWYAFFNFWVNLGFLPASLLPFVHSGPFAWSGVFAFWVPAVVFGAWFMVTTYLLLQAINSEEKASLSRKR